MTSKVADVAPRSFAFIFPMASGHINPSLPVARTLVQQGHHVHYLCRQPMRDAIEDTGAKFHLDIEELTELYDGREPFLFGALPDVQRELGLENDSMIQAVYKLREIMTEMMLPGAIRWLQKIHAHAVVCCPLMNTEAVCAANVVGVPCVGIFTTAGPGSSVAAMTEFLASAGLTPEGILEERSQFQPLTDCLRRLEANYGLRLNVDDGFRPLGQMPNVINSALTLVTTSELLQDPMTPELEKVYNDAGSNIVCVGPLLDKEGAKRAAGHKFTHVTPDVEHEATETDPLLLLMAAKALGRKVIYVSMGTVITGDSNHFGWTGRLEVNGKPTSVSGKELCQAAWGGAFDAFGSSTADDGPLLLVSLGPQADALDENLQPPPNACCRPVMPQVDLLKAGVDLFLTHGGQNSFTEALSTSTPMVVCPGFGDQPVNARKAVGLGVGLQVERPMQELEYATAAAVEYRKSTSAALEEVFVNAAFKIECERCAEDLRAAGGVPRAAQLILDLASHSNTTPSLPRLLGQTGQAVASNVRAAEKTAINGLAGNISKACMHRDPACV
jgi:UDP:flavonoid glycosyltransferase YjiC (YdhE family)